MTVAEKIQAFLNEMSIDVVEERVVDYIIKEVQSGRRMSDALHDPYVKNRLSEERLAKVLETPEIIEAIEKQIAESFRTKDFGLLS